MHSAIAAYVHSTSHRWLRGAPLTVCWLSPGWIGHNISNTFQHMITITTILTVITYHNITCAKLGSAIILFLCNLTLDSNHRHETSE